MIKDSYNTEANVPQRFTSSTLKQIEPHVEKDTLDRIRKLLDKNEKPGIRCSTVDDTPFHLWTNKDGNTTQNTPIHTDKYPTLLTIVSGTGYKRQNHPAFGTPPLWKRRGFFRV